MIRIWSLARITFLEGIRNRSVFGIALFSLLILGLNIAIAGFFMRDIGKVTVDMNLGALSFAGLLLVFFVGINLMAKDIDKKTIHLVLSKPISRVEYIFGKYLGVIIFVFLSLIILLSLSCATTFLLQKLYPAYFGNFSWKVFFIASFFIFLKLCLLSAIVVFFSAITTSSFITLIFSICLYLVGSVIEEAIFYLQTTFAAQELAVSEQLRTVIEVISYVVPNFAALDFSMEAAHGLVIETSRLGFALGYATTYAALLLIFASLIFQRREFN